MKSEIAPGGGALEGPGGAGGAQPDPLAPSENYVRGRGGQVAKPQTGMEAWCQRDRAGCAPGTEQTTSHCPEPGP